MPSADPVRRRAVLASSVGLCLTVAGCSSVFGESTEPETHHPPPLHEIKLWNFYHLAARRITSTSSSFDEEIRPTLVVERNGERVHQNTYQLPDQGWNIVSISNKSWMGCGRYEVTTELRNESREATVDFRSFEPSDVVDGKVQPVRLDVSYHPEQIDIGPVPLDDSLVRCDGSTAEREGANR